MIKELTISKAFDILVAQRKIEKEIQLDRNLVNGMIVDIRAVSEVDFKPEVDIGAAISVLQKKIEIVVDSEAEY